MTSAYPNRILVIEDDNTLREGLQTVLQKAGYRVLTARDGIQGSQLFRRERPDLVITDLKLPGKDGMQLLTEFRQQDASVIVILISAYGTIDLAVQALKSGAGDFIAKPFSVDELKSKLARLLDDRAGSRDRAPKPVAAQPIIGSSAVMTELLDQITQIARVDSPVLISGESGTGKELVAREIHARSPRRNRRFLAVNCGAFTDTLLESELFGHEKGSFTGAVRRHQGIFEQADGGTILLDEVAEVSPQMQVKLLRILQHQSFQRLGGMEEIRINVRIIAATNRDLEAAIRAREFRPDLFYRLNVIPVHIPPLRERPGDIPELIDHIMTRKCTKLKRAKPEFAPGTLNLLQTYHWPGNIRELENFLERLLIFSTKSTIQAADICLENQLTAPEPEQGLTAAVEKTELEMITAALEECHGNKQQAAKRLGIKTGTLYYKLQKYGLHPDAEESPA